MSHEQPRKDEAMETQWAAMAARFKSEGPAIAPSLITSIVTGGGDAKMRDALLRRAVRAFAFESWPQEYLDVMIAFGDAAIAHAEAESEAARRLRLPSDAEAWLDTANISCFNMAANLCALWGDSYVRTAAHYERGLAYADRALAYREQLKKGDGPFSMAYWARGVHALALGRFAEASQAFGNALAREQALAKAQAKPTDVTPSAAGSLLNSAGFKALADWRAGNAAAAADFAAARDALAHVVADPAADQARKDDAQGYLDQLTAAARLH